MRVVSGRKVGLTLQVYVDSGQPLQSLLQKFRLLFARFLTRGWQPCFFVLDPVGGHLHLALARYGGQLWDSEEKKIKERCGRKEMIRRTKSKLQAAGDTCDGWKLLGFAMVHRGRRTNIMCFMWETTNFRLYGIGVTKNEQRNSGGNVFFVGAMENFVSAVELRTIQGRTLTRF